jgi:hypothetical protein
VDGKDTLTQAIPPGILTATKGRIKFRFTPRHSGSKMILFNPTYVRVFRAYKIIDSANKYISVYFDAVVPDKFYLEANYGTGYVTANALGSGLISGVESLIDVEYTSSWIRLVIDGVQKLRITTPVNFGIGIPDLITYSDVSVDAVFSPA